MINFCNVAPAVKVSRDLVLGRISPEMIHAYYLGQYGFRKLNKKFSSPFRRDTDPSAEVRVNRSGKLVFNDYGGKQGLDCFDVVQALFKLDFIGALNKVAGDFGIIDGRPVNTKHIEWARALDKRVREETLIQFELLDWPEDALLYWSQFHITKEELEKDKDAFAIGQLCINGSWISNPKQRPQFVYVMHDVETPKVFFKVYRPYYARSWYSNCPNHIPFGYRSLPFATDTLVITKSYKDMKVLRKFHPDVCATQNESVEAARFVLELLKGKYKRFILWYDADETGLHVASELKNEVTRIVTTPLHFSPMVKDPADFISYYGPDATRELALKNIG